MLITFQRRFFKKYPSAVFTVFKLFDFNDQIIDQQSYNELHEKAVKILKNTEAMTEKHRFLLKYNLNFNSLISINEQVFNTENSLLNMLNMLSVVTGYTYNLIPLQANYINFDIDNLNDQIFYGVNKQILGIPFYRDVQKIQYQKENLLFLESIDESNYEQYLEAISTTSFYLNKIFGIEIARKILSIISDTADTTSQAEIAWTSEGWDQYAETALVKKCKNKNKIKFHI